MWKYFDKSQSKDTLLSLKLIDCEQNEYLKKLYSISNNIEKNYKIHKIRKKNGKLRTIYEPNPTLKHIQRVILDTILNQESISKYAKAYHPGISLKDNALPHVNKKIILKLDIKDFFDNIDFLDIYNSCFSIEYFPKSIGMLLTYLCCYDEHLPQGAPTSAYISNLVMKSFDEEIGFWCEEKNINYTRYSDDMTFSGDFNPSEIIKKVGESLKNLGLELNKKKIHIITNSSSQSVTGVVVNQKAQVSKTYRNKIRQEIYYIKKFGIDSHMKKIDITQDKDTYLWSIFGKILFVLQINNKDQEFQEYKSYIKSLIN